jgi:histidine triad (HIT) family protein
MSSIFSRIINREIPAYIIAEDDDFIAFLDVFPLTKGHTLVVPKQEIDYIFDIDDKLLGDMIVFAKRIAKAVGKAIPCTKVGVTVIGLEVPHAHIHLVPIDSVGDINFAKPKVQFDKQVMELTADAIKSFL